jgi:hypothetical protein
MASIALPRRLMRRRELPPATLKLRFAALLINLAATLAVLALTIAAGVLAYRPRKPRSERERPLHAIPVDLDAVPTPARRWPGRRGLAEALQLRPVKLGLTLIAIALKLRRAEPRGLGFRLLGLGLVDAHSGGEPSRRQRLVREIARRLWRALHQRLLPTQTPAAALAQKRVREEIATARRAHADNQAAFQRAAMRIYRENRVDARVSCLPLLARLALIAAIDTPMRWSPLAQSPIDWLSGTVVVVDRRHRPRARRRRRPSSRRV